MEFKPKEIFEGWKNVITNNPSVQELAKYRKAVCDSCPSNSTNAKKLSEYKTLRPEEHCVECGCTLIAKQAAPSSSCPLKHWEK